MFAFLSVTFAASRGTISEDKGEARIATKTKSPPIIVPAISTAIVIRTSAAGFGLEMAGHLYTLVRHRRRLGDVDNDRSGFTTVS
jgi:hypothetical protein